MILLAPVTAAVFVELVFLLARDLRGALAQIVGRLLHTSATATATPTATATGWVPPGVMRSPLEGSAHAPRNTTLPGRRWVHLALYAQAHDELLTYDQRRALHALGLDWYVQGERVEASMAVWVGSDLHARAVALAPFPLAEIPRGASRCWVCGCAEVFACVGPGPGRGCAWWRPNHCTACARRTESVPRRPLAGGARVRPLPAPGPTLDDEERAEREGRELPARRTFRRARVGATWLPGRHASPARAAVFGQVPGLIVPTVAARGLALAELVVLTGFRRDVSAALLAPLDGDPDEAVCLALARRREVFEWLPSGAAGRLLDRLALYAGPGLCVVWLACGRVELVELDHVTDATVAGRRAS